MLKIKRHINQQSFKIVAYIIILELLRFLIDPILLSQTSSNYAKP